MVPYIHALICRNILHGRTLRTRIVAGDNFGGLKTGGYKTIHGGGTGAYGDMAVDVSTQCEGTVNP